MEESGFGPPKTEMRKTFPFGASTCPEREGDLQEESANREPTLAGTGSWGAAVPRPRSRQRETAAQGRREDQACCSPKTRPDKCILAPVLALGLKQVWKSFAAQNRGVSLGFASLCPSCTVELVVFIEQLCVE
jgi:hypothetical protein